MIHHGNHENHQQGPDTPSHDLSRSSRGNGRYVIDREDSCGHSSRVDAFNGHRIRRGDLSRLISDIRLNRQITLFGDDISLYDLS